MCEEKAPPCWWEGEQFVEGDRACFGIRWQKSRFCICTFFGGCCLAFERVGELVEVVDQHKWRVLLMHCVINHHGYAVSQEEPDSSIGRVPPVIIHDDLLESVSQLD